MVVSQSEFERRETYKNSKCGSYSSVGCSNIRRLGSTLPRTADSKGSVEQGRGTTPHKCNRNERSQIGDRTVLQDEKTNSLTNRQRDSTVPLDENGRYKERRTQQNFEENFGVPN